MFNIGPDGPGTSVAFIAAKRYRAISSREFAIAYTGGDRGWVGDVPRFLTRPGNSPGWVGCRNCLRTTRYSAPLTSLLLRPLHKTMEFARPPSWLRERRSIMSRSSPAAKRQRLAELFPGLPKALVPIGGKPVLAHQLELAAGCGVTAVTILAGHLSGKIADFVGNGSAFGVKAQIFVETEPLGSAGALMQHLDALPEHFFVFYGDRDGSRRSYANGAIPSRLQSRLHLSRSTPTIIRWIPISWKSPTTDG